MEKLTRKLSIKVVKPEPPAAEKIIIQNGKSGDIKEAYEWCDSQFIFLLQTYLLKSNRAKKYNDTLLMLEDLLEHHPDSDLIINDNLITLIEHSRSRLRLNGFRFPNMLSFIQKRFPGTRTV